MIEIPTVGCIHPLLLLRAMSLTSRHRLIKILHGQSFDGKMEWT